MLQSMPKKVNVRSYSEISDLVRLVNWSRCGTMQKFCRNGSNLGGSSSHGPPIWKSSNFHMGAAHVVPTLPDLAYTQKMLPPWKCRTSFRVLCPRHRLRCGTPPPASGPLQRSFKPYTWFNPLARKLYSFCDLFAISNSSRFAIPQQRKEPFGGFEVCDGPLLNVVFPHTTLAAGGRHVGMRNVHDLVLGNFVNLMACLCLKLF